MKLVPKKEYKIYLNYELCNILKYPLLSSNELIFTSDELIHAIITCGLPRYYLTNSSFKNRVSELLYKINIIECALEEKPDSTNPKRSILIQSNNLKYLDASEQSALSYYTGMFFTKLISKKIFSIQYLVHLNMAISFKTITFATPHRPDLIGFNLLNNEYSVFEAKGRKRFNRKTLNNAFNQAMAIKTISGYKPTLRVANLIYFKNHILHSYIKDPKAEGSLCINLSPEDILKQYYLPLLELIKINSRNIHQQSSLTINLHDNHKLTIVIPNVLFTLLENEFNLARFKESINLSNPSNDFVKIHFE